VPWLGIPFAFRVAAQQSIPKGNGHEQEMVKHYREKLRRSTSFFRCSVCAGPARAATCPDSGALASVSGSISQLNYGREMEVTSFLVNKTTLVTFPPHVGWTVSLALKAGEGVQVTGYDSTTATGMTRTDLVTLTVAGRTFTVPQPGQFTSYNGSGTVTQLNYNREGEVDGRVLSNGVFAKTPPPFGQTLTSTITVGSQVSITGYSHQAMNGWTIVDVQSTSGQIIAVAGPPPPRPR
jgi:hypothetical protein